MLPGLPDFSFSGLPVQQQFWQLQLGQHKGLLPTWHAHEHCFIHWSKQPRFFYVGTPSGVHLFDHFLWSIFQSSIRHNIKQFLQVLTCFMVTFCGQICQSPKYILELYFHIQILINQLLIFTEKFSPLPEFEPGTSPVPSRCPTNWAILVWISNQRLQKLMWPKLL